MTPRKGIQKRHRRATSPFHQRNHARRQLLRRPTSPPSGSHPPVATVPDPAQAPNLPECTLLTQFVVEQDSIAQYISIVPRSASYMDCFINALQLLRVLDAQTANIMRVSSAGVSGFTHVQIVSIFIILTGRHHDFKRLPLEEFWMMLHHLPRGNAVLAGFRGQFFGIGHVFLIRKTVDDRLEYLDPQTNTICDLETPECRAIITSQPEHHMLFHSPVSLSTDQLRQWGFVLPDGLIPH